MGPQTAIEHRVAVDQDMLRRDRRRDRMIDLTDEGSRFRGRDMLQHDLQRRIVADQRHQYALDEYRLAIEDIDRLVRHLAMDQQRHTDPLHRLQHIGQRADIGDTMRRIGRRMGRV
ncbi:hypothetical protein WR25_22858 [Diploscapter pachys]|uniref:Uncharacterized protein n=1 Tax=Diploscapter pachys TaxID=2018661 RepID=A0A2A2K615_9BILA|nr:hypothetical protein WR25_22858 [Diploscapter pachys]